MFYGHLYFFIENKLNGKVISDGIFIYNITAKVIIKHFFNFFFAKNKVRMN